MPTAPLAARTLAQVTLALSLTQAVAADTLITLDALPLSGPDTYWNGADASGGFGESSVWFRNVYNSEWGSWSGFAYSNVNDPNTASFLNQYAVISGTGRGGLGNYAVAYDQGTDDRISFSSPARVNGFYLNNTTYTARSMLEGDPFAKQFGGAEGTDPDWFRLTITGLDASEQPLGTLDFYLADYRSSDSSADYVVTDWTWLDATSLGDSVAHLDFSLASSDVGAWGMNTPGYFALDDLSITQVPEPSTLALAGVSLALFLSRLARRRAT